jgi:hypothetical protein
MTGSAPSATTAATAKDQAPLRPVAAPGVEPLDEALIETGALDAEQIAAAVREARQVDRQDPAPLPGAVLQLLRSAVALQAEDLLRTIGALALAREDVREWTGLVERDVRDLAFLSSSAVAAGAQLPAGLDGGQGDPGHPGTVIEGLLASHEALMDVLRQLAQRCADPRVRYTVRTVLERREEEATVLRALGAGKGLPNEVQLVHGTLPKYQA